MSYKRPYYEEDTQPYRPESSQNWIMTAIKASLVFALGVFFVVIFIGGLTSKDRYSGYSSTSSPTCKIIPDEERGNPLDIDIIIAGKRQDDVRVDLFLPGKTRALPVKGQLTKKFIDTDELYIQQYYAYDTNWTSGTYKVKAVMNGKTFEKSLYVSNTSGQVWYVHVYCD